MDLVDTKSKEMPFKEAWFPKCWLVFCFHGLPSDTPAVQLVSGMGTTAMKKNLEALMANSTRTNRRLARELDSPSVISVEGCSSVDGTSGKRRRADTQQVQHVVKMEVATLDPDAVLDRQIKTAEKRLEMLVKMFQTHTRIARRQKSSC